MVYPILESVYTYAKHVEDEDVFPFEDITKLFPIRDLEPIYKAFKSTGGKYEMMYRTFQELDMKE